MQTLVFTPIFCFISQLNSLLCIVVLKKINIAETTYNIWFGGLIKSLEPAICPLSLVMPLFNALRHLCSRQPFENMVLKEEIAQKQAISPFVTIFSTQFQI